MRPKSRMEKGKRVVASKRLVFLDFFGAGLKVIKKGTGGLVVDKGRRRGYWIVAFATGDQIELNHKELSDPELLDRITNAIFG